MVEVRIALFLGLALASVDPGRGATPDGEQRLNQRVQTAFQQAQQKNCTASLATMRSVFGDKGFQFASEPGRAAAYQLAAACALDVKQDELAYQYAVAGTSLKGASGWLWNVRLAAELQGKRQAAAVATIEAMAKGDVEALNSTRVRYLSKLAADIRRDGQAALLKRLLAALSAPTYRPDEVAADASAFRRDYAALLADEGRKAEAAALVATIEDPETLLTISVDPRLRASIPVGFDGRADTERALARAREVAASHPASMAAVLAVTRTLRKLGRSDEMLATLEAAHPDTAQPGAFFDLEEQRNWWWDQLATSYQLLGRYDDAVSAYRSAMNGGEEGRANVSQTINLASMQVRFGHPAEALATLAAFDKGTAGASPYGYMVLHGVRACAEAALGREEPLAAELTYIASHERDAPAAVTEASLCANDLDRAAASIIRRLDDADERAEALLELSDYDPLPSTYPRYPSDARVPALKARADVQAAIKRAGGIRRFHLPG